MDLMNNGLHQPAVSEFISCLVEIMTRKTEDVQLTAQQLVDFPQWLQIAGDRCLAVRAHQMMKQTIQGARFVKPEHDYRQRCDIQEEFMRMRIKEIERTELARIQEEQARIRAERARDLAVQAQKKAEFEMQLELKARAEEAERARIQEERKREQEKQARELEERRKQQEKLHRELEEKARREEEERRNEPPIITNKPHVNFMSFLGQGKNYLKLNKYEFPLKLARKLNTDVIEYPIGVAYDEKASLWFICDRNTHKMVIFNTKTEAIHICDQLNMPTAVMVYEEGRSVAVLCAFNNLHTIHCYNHSTPKHTIETLFSHKEEMYDMKFQLRGLAKSVGSNIISLETNTLRVLKKRVGGKFFEMPDTKNPSFLATYRTFVAVSDVVSSNVFIFNLDDRNWDAVTFSKLKVIATDAEISTYRLCDQSGFKFVSGMQFDILGNLMIADSKGHTMKVYNSEFKFVHRISSDFALPYVSCFHINQQGECVLLDTKDPKRKLVRVKLSSTSSLMPWVRPEYWGPRKF